MGTSDIWIPPLIERCLSFYLNGSKNKIHLEDDGSNLRFTDHNHYSALIDKWTVGEGISITNLTDTNTQIEAILARESLEEYNREFPDRPLSKDAVRGYTIHLLDFEVVFEYSTSEPKLHLYVKRFSIAWDSSKNKGPPQGRTLRRNARVQGMMRDVFIKVKAQGTRVMGSVEAGYDSDGSVRSQIDKPSQNHGSQEFLMSQVPSIHPTKVALVSSMQGHSNIPDNLLGHLKPHSKVPAPVYETIVESLQKNPPSALSEMMEKSQDSEHSVEIVHGHPVSADTQPYVPVSYPEAHGNEIAGAPDCLANIDHELPPKEINGTDLSGTIAREEQLPGSNPESNSKGIEKEKPQSTTQKESPKQTVRVHNNPVPNRADPWGGMTEIRKIDITVPKDQENLLENYALWVPPAPGERMPQGHVPPQLLHQWNQIALRKSRVAEEMKPKSLEPEPIHSREPSPVTTNAVSDSDSEISWSQSPPEKAYSRRQILPADSSPIRMGDKKASIRFPRGDNSPKDQLPNDTQEHQPPGGDQEIAYRREENFDSILESVQGPGISLGASSPTNLKQVNDKIASEPGPVSSRGGSQDPQDESDGESDDSVMDMSVPHPLGGDSQQINSTCQSKQELNSSGPSLPGLFAQERVQVMETPATDFSRLRSAKQSKDNSGLELGQCSSPPAQFSSQSRIFNTYASNDSNAKGDTFQESSNLSQMHEYGESNGVDVMGTQISSGNWSMKDMTPQSYSAFVLDSSGPKACESSVLINTSTGQAEGSSNPFSSYREMPSSILTDDGNQDSASIHSPARYLSDERAVDKSQIYHLKRSMSEIETDEHSPMKRHKTEYDGENGLINGPTSNIMSRRQGYIDRSDEHAEAQRVFEKFRSDYPRYAGDFGHFTKLCSKLQALRAQGNLRRSFLWDDFIILHLQEYPRFLEQCPSMETKFLEYEAYFTSYFSKPSCKKRSLTAHGIEISAAQYVPANDPGPPTSPFVIRNETNSFTGSLVDKLSNFHTHSFGPATQDMPAEADIDRMTFIMSSPTPHGKVNREPAGHGDRPAEKQSDMKTTPRLSPLQEVNRERDSEVIPESEANHEEVEEDLMDETHETASIELGDGEPSTAPQTHLSVESEATSEPENTNENWFVSLRHLRPTGSVWSDDPNTPFKVWARADQNVKVEVKRRGGVYLPIDKKGVIQRPGYRD